MRNDQSIYNLLRCFDFQRHAQRSSDAAREALAIISLLLADYILKDFGLSIKGLNAEGHTKKSVCLSARLLIAGAIPVRLLPNILSLR